jgi:transcription antitermination protein NusB
MSNVAPPPTRRPALDRRHRAREAALQMLYQWELSGQPMEQVADTFWSVAGEHVTNLDDASRAFARSLADGVVASLERLDPLIADAATHWRIERMNVLDRLILRLAVYEFIATPETPAKVVINEALELARTFSSDDAVRFINGILDAIRRTVDRT